jgi:hypothetical protein
MESSHSNAVFLNARKPFQLKDIRKIMRTAFIFRLEILDALFMDVD